MFCRSERSKETHVILIGETACNFLRNWHFRRHIWWLIIAAVTITASTTNKSRCILSKWISIIRSVCSIRCIFSWLRGLRCLAYFLIFTANAILPHPVIYLEQKESLKYKFSWQPRTVTLFQENELSMLKEVIICARPACSII